MQKFLLKVIVLFVVSHLCVAQTGYSYPRPDGQLGGSSTIPPGGTPLRPGGSPGGGFPSSASPGFPSSATGFGGSPTTPTYSPTGYPGASRPSGPGFAGRPGGSSGFPTGPQADTGITPSGPGFGITQTGPTAGFPGSSTPGFGSRPGGAVGPTGPTNAGGFPVGPGSPSRPGTGFPSGPSGPSFPSRPGTGQFPGQQSQYPGTAGGIGGGSGVGGGRPGGDDGQYEEGDYSAIPGEPGQDYPIYSEIPQTSFDCNSQQYPGYYADVEAQCQVFHICALNRTFDFLCPNGTIFSQEHLVCVWWNQFDCNSAPGLYGNNAYIYDYSQTGQNSQQGGQGGAYPGAAQIPTGGIGSTPRPQLSGTTYPGSQRPGGSAGFPGTGRPTGPSSNYPGATGPQGPTATYPGATGPQGPSASYPGAIGPQGPSASFPGAVGPQGPSVSYPGPQGPVGPTGGFPSTVGGPSGPSAGFPGASIGPGAPSGFQTTPRPGFPVQGDTQFPVGGGSPQTPNREYLPPRRI